MFAINSIRLNTLAKRHSIAGLTLALVVTCLASDPLAADGPVRLRRSVPNQQMQWSPARIDADAAAIQDRAPRLVQRSAIRPTQRPVAKSTSARQRSAIQTNNQIQQVGFLEDYGTCSTCGPVCDCGEPACGIEGGYIVEPGCGMEPGYAFDPGCGMEPVCGVEPFAGPCGCDACYSGIGSCDGYACEPACQVDCFPLFLPILRIDWSRFEFFIGNQGYHNPMNDPATGATTSADSGSFGFHQGFNEGRDLRPWLGLDLAAQFGLRATQSNLHGEDFTTEQRNQIFLTGGLFRRVDYGLQYGLVLDYLNEDWYYQADLLQLRGELSWKWSPCHGFGFHWMGGVSDETVPTSVTNAAGAAFAGTETIKASTQYRAFYRYSFGSTGQWTSYIGGTDDEHFIIGSDMDIPLRGGLGMQIGSTYFSPGDESVIDDHQAEGWNVSISMIYRPGMGRSSRYRLPMFNVADNGSFFVFR
jgi:hypothetical protein